MNVAELRELLSNFDDDAPVRIRDTDAPDANGIKAGLLLEATYD